MEKKLSYKNVLLEIDKLRAKGIKDDDPKMRSLKLQLWGHLEENRKKRKYDAVVPTVMAVKTVKLEPKVLGETTKTADNTLSTKESDKKEDSKPYAKYVLLGIVIALVVVLLRFLKKD